LGKRGLIKADLPGEKVKKNPVKKTRILGFIKKTEDRPRTENF